MNKYFSTIILLLLIKSIVAQNVGIGTSTPFTRLHVADSSVLFSAIGLASPVPGNPPIQGAGRRMMWYADKAAFRAGYTPGNSWDKVNTGIYSFAAGNNTTASGTSSTAMGSGTSASGNYATAMGQNTTAGGTGSTATGFNTNATGSFSVAIGQNANASGDVSIATGYGTIASGNVSTAMGDNTVASGLRSTAMGQNSNANGNYSTSMGQNTIAFGTVSTAMGGNTNATGNYSTAMGKYTDATGYAATAIGDSSLASGAISFASGFRTTASGAYSTATGYEATASGDFSTAMGYEATASSNFSTAIGNYVSTNNKTGSFIIGDNSSAAVMMSPAFNSFSARFAGGYRLFTNPNLTAGCFLNESSNAWSTPSDVRTKENFAEINGEDFLQKISGFHLTSWNYKTQDPKIFRHYGPMAQDFYAAFGKDKYGTIGNDTTINSADFAGVSFIAIQALEKRTQKIELVGKEQVILKIMLKNQETMIQNQQKQIDELKALLSKLNVPASSK
jgi:Head domain of trimeric autotransporter adhesin/Chaperone of endosialidase